MSRFHLTDVAWVNRADLPEEIGQATPPTTEQNTMHIGIAVGMPRLDRLTDEDRGTVVSIWTLHAALINGNHPDLDAIILYAQSPQDEDDSIGSVQAEFGTWCAEMIHAMMSEVPRG